MSVSSQDCVDVLAVLKQSLEDNGYGNIVEDRFYDTYLLRKGPRDVPAAFTDTGLLLGAAVVLPSPDSTLNAQNMDVPDVEDDNFVFWLYAPDDDTGWANLNFLIRYIKSLFRDGDVLFTRGVYGFFQWVGGMRVRRNHEEFQGSINANVRFLVTKVEPRIVPAYSAIEANGG